MTTKRKSKAVRLLERVTDGPLSFGKLLEAIRLGEDLSQVEFAKTLRISKAYLCDLEKERRCVSPERAATFATLLGYSQARFVKLALQDLLDRGGLDLRVEVMAA